MLFLDGVYVERPDGSARFRWVKAPTSAERNRLAHTIARRVGRMDAHHPWRAPFGRTSYVQIRSRRICLERQGLLERDEENSYLAGELIGADPMDQLLGASITYRIAVGPNQGRKKFTLQTLPAWDDSFGEAVGKVAGLLRASCPSPFGPAFGCSKSLRAIFVSLHAGVAAKAQERQKLERLCRYITRPAVSEKRLSLTEQGQVCYELKTPYRDGTTHVIFEPLDFIARLAALVPKPRTNLTRFHGVFAPNSQRRARVTPAKRGTRP